MILDKSDQRSSGRLLRSGIKIRTYSMRLVGIEQAHACPAPLTRPALLRDRQGVENRMM
ncbi:MULTISPECIES: hypothetical protein [Streptomyces]|uniref:hypothetical protein n=1 Tax=Streptomyces TaxID=1883 RepID=UPI001788CD40|nr:hypothetical protein [Streptomyces triticiradicis]